MITLIVTGHIQFATAMRSVVTAIAGEEKNIAWVDFAVNETREDLAGRLQRILDAVPQSAGILFLTDVPSGTPFQVALTLGMARPDCMVLTGTNVSMITEALFEREGMAAVCDLADHLVETGKQAVAKYRL